MNNRLLCLQTRIWRVMITLTYSVETINVTVRGRCGSRYSSSTSWWCMSSPSTNNSKRRAWASWADTFLKFLLSLYDSTAVTGAILYDDMQLKVVTYIHTRRALADRQLQSHTLMQLHMYCLAYLTIRFHVMTSHRRVTIRQRDAAIKYYTIKNSCSIPLKTATESRQN